MEIKIKWGLGIGDWGLGIGDWAQSPIPNPQSPIPNPQSPIPNYEKYYKEKMNIKLLFNKFIFIIIAFIFINNFNLLIYDNLNLNQK